MKKVYFNHIPWNIHTMYQEMLANPPKDTEYINKNDFENSYENTFEMNVKSTVYNKIIEKLKKIYFLPNLTFKRLPGDIVFSCQSIPIFNDFILDLDCYEALNRFSRKHSENIVNKYIVKKILSLKRCKKIVFWSESAKLSFQSYIWNSLNWKLETVYPWINVENNLAVLRAKKPKTITKIVSIWKDFKYKWILDILKASQSILSKNQCIKIYIIWNVAAEHQEKYKDPQIEFLWLLPREQCLKYISESNIFLLPSFVDIFWYSYLEAFSLWTLAIAWESYASSEIIENWQDWIIIQNNSLRPFFDYSTKKKSYISLEDFVIEGDIELAWKIEKEIMKVIENKQIYDKHLEKWYEKVKNWKFSTDARNEKLFEIFHYGASS